MAYVKFNVVTELKRVVRDGKTKADPVVLLRLVADHPELLTKKS
jgi:hypothetical protein